MMRIDFSRLKGRQDSAGCPHMAGVSSGASPTPAASTAAITSPGSPAEAPAAGSCAFMLQASAIMPDVTLLLEGTYPYVRGGVSSWVHDLITGLPEVRFALVYLGAEAPAEEIMRYQLPPNVVALHRYYLMTPQAGVQRKPASGDSAWFADSDRLHEWFGAPASARTGAGALGADDYDRLFDSVVLQEGSTPQQRAAEFFHSEAAWQEITDSYARHCPHSSLLAYFWAVRNTHAPLFKLAEIARAIPVSRIYHAVTTGYAGLLGAMLKRRHARPLMLTEHGIYTKERKMDLQAMFLGSQTRNGASAAARASGMEHHEDLWLRLFEGIGRMAYAASDPIISLYDRNRQRQVRDGAEVQRTRIVPNGVDVERYAPLRARRPVEIPQVVGLIGRIVPIKDIKTFIRAIGILARSLPAVEGWLIGPEEEDKPYVAQCRQLVATLGLERHIRFLGFQRIEDVLPRLGLLALTSISEAFPLVIGEAYASGLPVITTDVGACRELIDGADEDDRALGSGGIVVPICDPAATAQAALSLLSDSQRWHAAQQAGIERVERYYRQQSVLDSYRELYRGLDSAAIGVSGAAGEAF